MNKFYMIVNLFLLSITASSMTWAKNDNFVKGTLCTEQEEIHFFCTLKNQKIVSVCRGDESSQQNYVQYRYGTPSHIEMKYPEKLLPAKGHIFYANESGGSVGSISLFFQTGLYRYTIFNTQGSQGLYVEKGDPLDMDKESIFFQRCDNSVEYDTNTVPYLRGLKSWEKSFQDGKEYKWTGKNKPM